MIRDRRVNGLNPPPGDEDLRSPYWHLILDNTRQVMGLLSREGVVLEINLPESSFFDLEQVEIVGNYLWDTPWWQKHPEVRQQLQTAVRDTAQGNTVRFSSEIAGRAGKALSIQFGLYPIGTLEEETDYLIFEMEDVSDLVETIEQLYQSQRMLELANRIAGVGYWSWNIRQDQVHLSKGLLRIFDPGEKLEIDNYQQLIQHIHPEDRLAVRHVLQTALENEKTFSMQFRITRRDGVIRSLQGLGEIIRGSNNQPAEMIGTLQDITEIRSLQDRLLDSENRYRYLVRELPDTGVVLFDPNLTVFLVEGDEFVRRYAADENVLGMPIPRFLAKILGELPDLEDLTYFHSALEGKTHSYEKITGERCFSVSYIPLRNNEGEIYAGMAVIQDITRRVRVAEKLSRLANQLRMLNHMGQLVVSNKDSGKIFKEVVSSISQLIDSRDVFIFLEKNGYLLIEAQYNESRLDLQGQGMPATDGIAGEVWRSQEGVLLSGDEARAKLFTPLAESVGYTPQSFLAVPITWQDQKFGVFEAVHLEAGKFSQDDLKLIESAAAWTAIALNNAIQHQRMERALSESRITAGLLEEILNASLSLKSVLQHIVEAGSAMVKSVEWAAIHLLDERARMLLLEAVTGASVSVKNYTLGFGQGIAGRVLETGHLINVPDVDKDDRVASYPRVSHAHALLVAPIKNREGNVVGTITLQSANPNQFTAEDENLLLLLAHQSGLAIENARLFEAAEYRGQIALKSSEQLRQLTRQLVTSQEDERARIARELHDEAGQSLTALKIALELLGNTIPSNMPEVRQALQDAADQAGSTMENLRGIAHNLRPPALDRLGLNMALSGLCGQFEAQTQIQTVYEGFDLPRLRNTHEITLYRFVQEALTNIAKHAKATKARVWLEAKTGVLEINVQDNGIGITTDPVDLSDSGEKGMGLASMEERLNSIGGTLVVQSMPGQGTHLRASLLLQARETAI